MEPKPRTSPVLVLSIVVVFVVALAAALFLLQGSRDSSKAGSKGDGGAIWKVGDEWTVQVKQDAGAVSPEGDTNVAKIPFHFTVAKAPEGAKEPWLVQVKQEGAEGPFAAGWSLYYVERDGKMVLSQVAMGSDDKPLEAELATIVLGSQFPYEVEYSAAPKDSVVTAAELIERSSLPPTSAPGAKGAKGAKGGDDLPEAPPLTDAVAPPSAAPVTPKR